MEHLLLGAIPQEVRLLELARSVSLGITSLGMPIPLTVFIGMNKTSDEEPRQVIEAVLSHLYAKHVVIVDSAVDTNDIRQVATAIALNVQSDRDVYIFPGQQGSACDPSCDDAGVLTAKMGIDATGRMRSAVRNTIPKHVLESIDMNELQGTAV
jgi:UbiD family decarboxylase